MKNLEFILQNNSQTLLKKICPYEIKDKEIIFSYENFCIKVLFEENYFYFIKESSEDRFVLSKHNDVLKCTVTLLDIDYSIELKVLNFRVINENKIIIINYTIESDADNEKTIILNFSI